MKIIFLLFLTLIIGLFLNYIFEIIVFRGKDKIKNEDVDKEDMNLMERGINDGCQTTVRLIVFCLVALFISLWLTNSIFT